MSTIYESIGAKIRELRGQLSQEALASKLEVTANKLSRWETGTYKPTAADLDKLSRFFNVPISVFFPSQMDTTDRVSALTSATGGLNDEDFEEVVRYAEFRKGRQLLKNAPGKSRKK